MNKRVQGYLGLLYKGGSLLVGEGLYYDFSRASLLIMAKDASKRTQKKFLQKAKSKEIETYYAESKEELGHCLGFEQAAAVAIAGKKAAAHLVELWKGGSE